jgi:hypothetical protein
MAPTRPRHGVSTGPAVSSTTIVRRLAAATRSIRRSRWTPRGAPQSRLRHGLSTPSLAASATTTTATSAPRATSAARARSVPSSKRTSTPEPARVVIAARGLVKL